MSARFRVLLFVPVTLYRHTDSSRRSTEDLPADGLKTPHEMEARQIDGQLWWVLTSDPDLGRPQRFWRERWERTQIEIEVFSVQQWTPAESWEEIQNALRFGA